jgi:hypothetical protein
MVEKKTRHRRRDARAYEKRDHYGPKIASTRFHIRNGYTTP